MVCCCCHRAYPARSSLPRRSRERRGACPARVGVVRRAAARHDRDIGHAAREREAAGARALPPCPNAPRRTPSSRRSRRSASVGDRLALGVEHARRAAGDDQPRRRQRSRARCAASTSALTLRSTPSASTPMLATTGMQPSRTRSASSDASVAVRLADQSEIGDLAATPSCSGAARRDSPIRPSAPVRPTARPPAAPIAATSVVFVRPGQHRDDRVERRLVGDPQAVDEARRLAARAQLGVDRAPAAVHDDERRRGGEADDRLPPRSGRPRRLRAARRRA